MLRKTKLALGVAVALNTAVVVAGGVPTLEMGSVIVEGDRDGGLAGTAESANVGTVNADQLSNRPIMRPGELVEVVPGLIVSQHSGEGKANQYYLRGFNLDHGTDMATSLDGIPINMPTHGHGQGWTDLNFLIPELVENIQYKKGPYYAEEGDFAAAGAVHIKYADKLDKGIASVTVGQDGLFRLLGANTSKTEDGYLTYALEVTRDDGPWDVSQDLKKYNGLVRYNIGDLAKGMNITGIAYDNQWTATDQIPRRAVEQGLITRWGSLDDSDGGETQRRSIGVNFWDKQATESTTGVLYAVNYNMDLYSNFTFFLEDPVNGDQFNQSDKRMIYGGELSHQWLTPIGELDTETEVGAQVRYDDIDVALYSTKKRQRLSTTRKDNVGLGAYSLYAKNDARWNDWFRTVAGVRADYQRAKIDSNLAANSGTADSFLVSPKLSMVFGPWKRTEYFVNIGRGFHSNDARGATITVNPKNPALPQDKVDMLVRATGYDLGLRTALIPHVQATLSLWALDLDGEQLFIGDAGTTEASRPSRRTGIEASMYYKPADWLVVDADYAFSRARFRDNDPAGDRIPGAVEGVASLGVSVNDYRGWDAGLRARYFGPRPLIEDDSVRSKSTFLVSSNIGYKVTDNFQTSLEILNIFDTEASAIDYYYESQLQGESGPVEDKHFHPVLPRTFRATVRYSF